MSKYTLKGKQSGKFFVTGKGFVATCAKEASQLSADEAEGIKQCARNLGSEDSTSAEVQTSSWAVTYIRKNALQANGKISQKPLDAGKNEIDPSRRRFATREEAITHGSRFNVRRANRGDEPGTAGHIGFYVTETQDPVNAKVNPKTGLTNPV
jgi:hypothetical protein